MACRPIANSQIEKREQAEKDSGLLHEERGAEGEAGKEKQGQSSGFFGAQEEDESDESGEDDEVSSVGRESIDAGLGGEKGITRTGDNSGQRSEKAGCDEVEQEKGRGVYEQQADVNSVRGLAKQGKNRGVGRVSAGQLHVVGQLIRRNALEYQLTSIGIFALVAFQRHVS